MNWKELNPANSSNRHDHVGLYHNLLLDEFISNRKLMETGSKTSLSFVNKIIDFMLTRAIELTGETPAPEI